MNAELIPLPETPLTRIMAKVGGIYRENRRWNLYEIETARHRLSHPQAESEADEITRYFAGLSPSDKRYFPNSVLRLIEKWEDILDKAALSKSFGQEPIKPTAQAMIHMKQLERVEDRIKKLRAAHIFDDRWDCPLARKEHNEAVQLKAELMHKLGMKI